MSKGGLLDKCPKNSQLQLDFTGAADSTVIGCVIVCLIIHVTDNIFALQGTYASMWDPNFFFT